MILSPILRSDQGRAVTDFSSMKARTFERLRAVAQGADPSTAFADDVVSSASHPFNQSVGIEPVKAFWRALRHAMPDLERRDMIFVGGQSAADTRAPAELTGRPLIAAMGHYQGTFANDFCGIPATRGLAHLRFCEVHHVSGDRIAQSYVLVDLLDLMRQAGVWPIAPSLGAEGMWPGPASGDGVRPHTHDPVRGAAALETVLAMHRALGAFDGRSVLSMGHGPYWAENFLWYGPAGVGATRGMDGFRAHHQVPFLTGFPDRRGASHYVRIADGDYVVTGGWPSVTATHTGEWLGLPGTGRRIAMRVMDFYRVDGETIAENWVPIDVLDILMQMGLDVLARLRHLRGDPRRDL